MKQAVRDRSIFLVISCVALVAAFLLSTVRVTPVTLDAEMAELMGQERSDAFSGFFEEFQTWYGGKNVTDSGVLLTRDGDYQKLVDMVAQASVYLERDMALDSLSPEAQEKYEAADMNLVYFIAGGILPVAMALGQQESFSCDQAAWGAIGDAMDQVMELYAA